jgi:tetratricopeptide (TPR) repeat protein
VTTAKVEVVTLPAEPVIKSAQDLAQPKAHSEQPSVENVSAPTNATPASPGSPVKMAENKSAKHGLLQRMNPLNLFRGEEKKEKSSSASYAPSARPPVAVTNRPAVSNVEVTVKPPPPPPPKPLPRYVYLAPPQPSAGNRAAAQVEFARGLEAQRAHNISAAIQAYRSAIQIDPSFFEAYYDLGLAEADAGEVSKALAAYQTALVIRPDSVEARYSFALALQQVNFPVDAAIEMEKVAAVQPNDVRAHLMLGLVYAQRLHQPDKARQHYLKVLELDPQNSQAGAIRYWLGTNP